MLDRSLRNPKKWAFARPLKVLATLGNSFLQVGEAGLLLCHANENCIWNRYTGVEKVGKNSNSLVVYNGISHVLVVMHGVSL